MCLGDPYGVQILLVHCFIEVFPGKSAWRPAQLSPAPIVRSVEALLSSASTLYSRIQAFKDKRLDTASSLACILTNAKSETDGDTEPLAKKSASRAKVFPLQYTAHLGSHRLGKHSDKHELLVWSSFGSRPTPRGVLS